MSYNYNDYNSQNQNDQNEEIRFDENDFQNPYSGYYRPPNNNFGQDFKVNEEPPRYCYTGLLDEENARRNFSRIGRGYALFTAISFVASYLIAYIVFFLNPEFYETTLFLNLLTPISLYAFSLPVLLIILSRCEAKAPEKRKMKFSTFMIFVLVSFGLMNLGALVGNSVMDYWSYYFDYDYSNNLQSIIDYDNLWITAIFTVIVAPIGEEFDFRKLIIDRTQRYGGFISVGLSALIFGLMHGNFYQFFYCFAIGLVLGYIYYSTGKLHLTIIIHAIVNFVGSILTTFLSPVSEQLALLDPSDTEALLTFVQENIIGIIGVFIYSLFTYAAMAAAIILPIIFRKKIHLDRGEIYIPKKKIMPIVILNGGVIAMLALYFLEFGLSLMPV